MEIKITDAAKKQMAEDFKTGLDGEEIRIFVKNMNWAGPNLGLAQDELKEDDKIVESEGFNFAIERQIFNVFNHIEIDYTRNWLYKNYNIKYR